MSQNHSAEWLRGAVESHINTCNLITSITSATKSHPARQGLMAAGNELHNQLDRYRALLAAAEAREAGEQCTCAGCMPSNWPDTNGWRCKKSREAIQPTAAEVIEAAEKALERLLPWALQAGANAEDALALCARWKEANGDGANTR